MPKSKLKKRGPFRIIESHEIYKNPWIRVKEDRVIRPDGKRGIFGTVTTLPGTSILAIDKHGYSYLIKEYEYAERKFFLQLPGGGMELKESPLQNAKRELREELGLESKNWQYLGEVHYYTTLFNTREHLFLTYDVKTVSEQHPEDKKLIKVIKVPFKKIVSWALSGKISKAECVTAILRADYFLRLKKHGGKKSRN